MLYFGADQRAADLRGTGEIEVYKIVSNSEVMDWADTKPDMRTGIPPHKRNPGGDRGIAHKGETRKKLTITNHKTSAMNKIFMRIVVSPYLPGTV